MNYNEFYNEFNLAYNNLASNQAAGLDRYEISVYLTKAQEALVDALYGEFEKSEEARRKLADLIETKKLSKLPKTTIPVDNNIYPDYTTNYAFPNDVRYIINEQVKMNSSANECIAGKYIKVQPCLHDEIDTIINNPYRFNIRRALRLDTAYNETPYIEILSKDTNIDYYQIRYVKQPNPIILETLTGDDYINGQQAMSLGSLPDITHRQIVEIAAKLAYNDYKN